MKLSSRAKERTGCRPCVLESREGVVIVLLGNNCYCGRKDLRRGKEPAEGDLQKREGPGGAALDTRAHLP